VRGIVASYLDKYCAENAHPDSWDLAAIETDVLSQFGVRVAPQDLGAMNRTEIEDHIYDRLAARYEEKEQLVGSEIMRETERFIMLHVIDTQWKDHLLSMDHLKEGIGLRGYGQKDPLVEYKKESFTLFQDMMDRIEDETVRYLYFLQTASDDGLGVRQPMMPFHPDGEEEIEEEEPVGVASEAQRAAAQSSITDFTRNIQRKKERELAAIQMVGGDGSSTTKQPVVNAAKVGRNDPCPCGSGKKYKKCCGA
jgi:preprotein translocase subunit SecA